MYGRLEWVVVMVMVVAGRAGGREKGGVGVGYVGMGGVCGGRREEEGGGRVVDAGFVLFVAYLKNSSNRANTTSQSVRWHPWLQPKIHPIVRAKHASLFCLDAGLHLCSFDPLSHSSSPSFLFNLAGLAILA